MESDSEYLSTPPDILNVAKNVTANLRPDKLKQKYEKLQRSQLQTKLKMRTRTSTRHQVLLIYHQKYYLQQHTWLCSSLELDEVNDSLLKHSHLATRLNAFLVGQGSLPQVEREAPRLGLDEQTLDYVRRFFIKYQGQGMTC